MTILALAGLLCWALQMAFALMGLRAAARRLPPPPGAEARLPVSVIICARNEAQNLLRNLPSVLAQRYSNAAGKPMYEVVVVNDASDDDSAAVLATLQARHEHLRVVHIPPQQARLLPGKKWALKHGVAAASHEVLLLTDADCRPASDRWIAHMAAPFALPSPPDVHGGYGPYERRPGLLNALVRWETLHTFIQYSAYARYGLPYMAVGRNLACSRALYERAAASAPWQLLPSGDDDLLVRCARSMQVCDDTAAFMYSAAKESTEAWMRQKQRHLSTGKYYKPRLKLLLGAYALSHALCWLLFFILLFTGYRLSALGLMGLRCLLYWGLWARMAARLGERGLALLMPLFDLGWLLYNFAFSPYIFWKNKQHWT